MKTLLTLNQVFYLIGIVVMLLVVQTLRDKGHPRRIGTALFWFLFGATFLFGDPLVALLGKAVTYRLVGVIVIVIAILAGTGRLSAGTYGTLTAEERQAASGRLGNRLFLPAVLIPVITVACTVGLKGVKIREVFLLDQSNLTLVSLAIACIVALLAAWRLTSGTPLQAVRESRRLVDAIGWAAILPQMLAMLGGVFVAAHTGQAIQQIIGHFVNPESRFLLVVIYGVGMAVFTMIMGNAFAAFPVMTAGIAMPFLVGQHHADVAPLMAIGMYSGYCGTLMTPMAANFNIVPAALLELKDQHHVIKVQIPTALALLAVNILLMYFIAFR